MYDVTNGFVGLFAVSVLNVLAGNFKHRLFLVSITFLCILCKTCIKLMLNEELPYPKFAKFVSSPNSFN
jgi:hypothetical protein